jgi:hypothetical protein
LPMQTNSTLAAALLSVISNYDQCLCNGAILASMHAIVTGSEDRPDNRPRP